MVRVVVEKSLDQILDELNGCYSAIGTEFNSYKLDSRVNGYS